MGKLLAAKDIEIIYGGGQVGLMGVLADAALEAGGRVCGIIPAFLNLREVAHQGLSEQVTVGSMHERKALIEKRSDGFLAMPGGFGTLDEFFEILTWLQLGLHEKPVGLLNISGFFDPVLAMMEGMVSEGFLRPENKNLVTVGDQADALLERMGRFQAPSVPKLALIPPPPVAD